MDHQDKKEILSVSQLNSQVRMVLEENFSSLWIEGEISNLVVPSSGHMYFSLKDANAQVRCAFFRGKNRLLNFSPKDGLHVLVHANVSLYEGRGEFQLIINQIELAGVGALKRQFELLKEKLAKEKLFDTTFKKPIPKVPTCIGIITSPTGAAIRDILITLKRRYPIAPVIIYPCSVQGDKAAKEIIESINIANRRKECDVLLLARGGGSFEDLWCFNDEVLARTIFSSEIPIVTGIGHEIDFTIADFVADVRAATPTAAAELISPNQLQWLEEFSSKKNRLMYLIQHFLKLTTIHFSSLQKSLKHPGQIIREQIQTLDFLEQKLITLQKHRLQILNAKLAEIIFRSKLNNPLQKIHITHDKLQLVLERLQIIINSAVKQKEQQLQYLIKSLNTISPLATMERGFSISRDFDSHKIIRSISQLRLKQKIEVRFIDGSVQCEVEKVL